MIALCKINQNTAIPRAHSFGIRLITIECDLVSIDFDLSDIPSFMTIFIENSMRKRNIFFSFPLAFNEKWDAVAEFFSPCQKKKKKYFSSIRSTCTIPYSSTFVSCWQNLWSDRMAQRLDCLLLIIRLRTFQ